MSNFHKSIIVVDNIEYLTSEHYFQCMKFPDANIQERIRQMPTPMMAAQEGRKRYTGSSIECYRIRPDWEQVKNSVMEKGVLAKFTQHKDLQVQLLSTGDAILIEHTRNDRYWGDGGDGSGQNWLGRTLMNVRDQLRNMQ